MAYLSALEALRVLLIAVKTYVNAEDDKRIPIDAIDPAKITEEYETLKAQVATIVAASGDDSASATEIVDARVAQGGTVYDSLGQHLRAIADGSALAADAVKSANIADGSITPDHLSELFRAEYYTQGETDNMVSAAITAAIGEIDQSVKDALAQTEAAVASADAAGKKAAEAEEAASNATSQAAAAQASARQAAVAAENAETAVNGLAQQVDEFDQKLSSGDFSGGVDISQLGLTEEDGKVYVLDTKTGEHGPEGWTIPTTGIGGGSASGVSSKLKITSGTSVTIAEGLGFTLIYTFTSVDADGDETGDGAAVITLGGKTIFQGTIHQGENSYAFTASQFSLGSNAISVSVTDADGNTMTRSCTVRVVALSVTSTFDASVTYSGAVAFKYTPIGSGITKTVHFILDGSEIGTADVTTTGQQQTFSIPAQTHGAHTFLVYATATIDGSMAKSNELYYEIVWLEDGNTAVVIASSYRSGEEVTEGTIITVPHLVIDPASMTASITRSVLDSTGKTYSTTTATVDRTMQYWSINDYPSGNITLVISCGTVKKEVPLTVTASGLNVQPTTSSQVYYLSGVGRSNGDDGKAAANWGDVSATLSNFNYSSDGWLGTVLRFQGDDTLEIGYRPFSGDIRSTGLTVEFEFTTIAARDKDAPIIACMSGGRGFEITAQSATLVSEQSGKSISYMEGERTRITISIESLVENRMVRLSINGVPAGVIQYPASDNFQQSAPAPITIGSTECSFDLHTIRIHTTNLTDRERINNWIYDRDTYADRAALAEKNDIYDDYGNLDRNKVQAILPAMYVTGQMSTGKKDFKDVVIDYVNEAEAARNFTDSLAYWYIQGTSSVGLPRKNWRIQLSNGYQLYADSIAQTLFTLKANYMDSSGACNTGMANMLHYIYRSMGYLTPPMQADENVRMCIAGFPFVLFHRTSESEAYAFSGLYTFNFDKGGGSEPIFGFDQDAYPGAQCWEFCNNTSGHCLFRDSDVSVDDIDTDLEVRYGPATHKILGDAIAWVIACENDTAKFADEVESWFNLNFLVAYRVFAETFGMSDSLAKNMMMGVWPSVGKQLYPIWYDMDTLGGRNNEGVDSFPYDMELHSVYGTQAAFNGGSSLLWTLVDQALGDQIEAMYQTLRSKGLLSVETVSQFLIEPFYGTIPAALYVEDAVYKYEMPTLNEGADELFLEQGDWAMHLLRWITLSLAYRDSKYNAVQFTSDRISLRIYSPSTANITDTAEKALVEASLAAVPPNQSFDVSTNIHMFPAALYGANGYQVQAECEEGGSVHLSAPTLTNYNDLETYLLGASWLTDIGDLSPKYPGTVDFSSAPLLQSALVGSRTAGYYNTNLTSVVFANNTMLRQVVLSNCPKLAGSIDVSNCPDLEEFYAENTVITGVSFPNGGRLRTAVLPATMASVILLNQPMIEDFSLEGYAGVKTLRIEGCPTVDALAIADSAENLERVRLIEVDWTLADSSTLLRLAKIGGIDENGLNTEQAVITGKCYVDVISATNLATIREAFPDLVITYGGQESEFKVTFLDADGNVAKKKDGTDCILIVERGQSGYDPIAAGEMDTPTKPSTVDTVYTFSGWGGSWEYVTADVNIIPIFSSSTRQYTVRYLNGKAVVQTVMVDAYGAANYTGADLTRTGYVWIGWDQDTSSVTSDMDVNAVFITPTLPAEAADMSQHDFIYSDNASDNAAYTFGEFVAICEAGLASTYWGEYDQIKMVPNSTEIKDTDIIFEFHAEGHYELADGSGSMAKTQWYMLGVLTATRRMNATGTNVGGWDATEMREWLNNTLFPSLPPQWRNVIKLVNILANAGDQSSEILTSEDRLYLPSTAELGYGTDAVPYKNEVSSNAQEITFSKYTSNEARIKKTYNGTGAATTYWLRSAEASGSSSFRLIANFGYSSHANSNGANGVCVGFSI